MPASIILNEWMDNLKMLSGMAILEKASEETGIEVWFEDPPDFSMSKIICGDISGLVKALYALNKKEMLAKISEFVNFCDVCKSQDMEFSCQRVICKKDKDLESIINALQSTPIHERDALCEEIKQASGIEFSRQSEHEEIRAAFRALLDKGYDELLARAVIQIRDINPCAACKAEQLRFKCPWMQFSDLAEGICWRIRRNTEYDYIRRWPF